MGIILYYPVGKPAVIVMFHTMVIIYRLMFAPFKYESPRHQILETCITFFLFLLYLFYLSLTVVRRRFYSLET